MADRRAYPDVPLFRYSYTAPTHTQFAEKLRAPALGGRGNSAELGQIVRKSLSFTRLALA